MPGIWQTEIYPAHHRHRFSEQIPPPDWGRCACFGKIAIIASMMYRRLFPPFEYCLSLIACSGPDAQDSAEALSQTPIVAPTSTQLPAPPGSETVGVTFCVRGEQGDYAMMYDQLSQRSRALVDFDTFVATYTDALEEARIVSLRAQPLAAEQSG